jgi:hypothetical protein
MLFFCPKKTRIYIKSRFKIILFNNDISLILFYAIVVTEVTAFNLPLNILSTKVPIIIYNILLKISSVKNNLFYYIVNYGISDYTVRKL